MHLKKKICTAIMGLTMLIGNIAQAEEPSFKTFYENSVTINEFDLRGSSKATTDEEFKLEIETELERKSELSNLELLDLGYTEAQISKLRTYITDKNKGVKSTVNLRDLGSNMTISFQTSEQVQAEKGNVSGDSESHVPKPGERYRVYVNWEWDLRPFWTGTEILAIGWGGIDENGNEAVLEVDRDRSYHDVQYTHVSQPTEYISTDLTIRDPWRGVDSKWKIQRGAYQKFAQRGKMHIYLFNEGVAPIHRFRVMMKYGHGTTVLTPSANFDGTGLSVSVSLSGSVSTEWQDSAVFNKYGDKQ